MPGSPWQSRAVKALCVGGISGQHIVVQARGGRSFIAADRFKDGKVSITLNGRHEAVRVGDTVFDNLSPEGIPAEEFFDDLHAIDDVIFEIRDF